MYHQFYELDVLPFENTPDARFFYASEQHREALAAIEYTIRMRKGFVLVTGDIGSGKTTVSRTMIERCSDQGMIIQVLHGHTDGFSLLRQVMRSLDIPISSQDDHASMLESLRQRLMDQIYQNRPVVLLVDEAQTLPDEALEELRLMSNFDTSAEKLVQVILIGQPELRTRLRSPRLAALRQRISLAKQLRPMNANETAGYIAHRIKAASHDPENIKVAFTPQAVAEIQRFTSGVPRLVNVACDNCLLLGFVKETHEITPAIVKRALEDMMPNFVEQRSWPSMPGLATSNGMVVSSAPQLRMTGS